MEKIKFNEEISMDKVHTLDQLTSRFQTIKDGLPEVVKNGKDHYGRLRICNKKDRQMVVFVSGNKQDLGFLDFGGASKQDLERWKVWSIRTNSNELSGDIEAGHGNGGKSFMVRGCTEKSTICGYYNNKINKCCFINNKTSVRYKPGIVEGLVDKEDNNYQKVLNSELQEIGLKIKDLPKESQRVFEKRKSFTFVLLKNVRDFHQASSVPRILHRLITNIFINLSIHAQTTQTIETCEVYVMIGKNIVGPLKVEDLHPYPGFESPIEFEIPEKLVDPETREEVEIPRDEQNKLILKTSKKNLRMSDNLQGRNVVRVRTGRNTIAAWSVADLVPNVQSSFILGDLKCVSLNEEHQVGSERIHLVDIPLTRALKHWTSEKIKELAERIRIIQITTDSTNDLDNISETLDRFRELMRHFLEDQTNTGSQPGIVGGTERTPKPVIPPHPLFGKRIDKIILETPGKTIRIAKNTIIPLVIKCYEIDEEGKEKPVINHKALEMFADKMEIIKSLGNELISGIREGEMNIYFETQDRRVRSNIIKLEIIEIKDIKINKPERILKQMESVDLKIITYDKKGKEVKGLFFEAHVNEMEMGSITRSGWFTAGETPGEVNISVVYGPTERDIKRCKLNIGEEKFIRNRRDSGGSNIPLILVCGKTAPGREELPQEQRTHTGGEEYPTIIDSEPIWTDVIWLNYKSKESQKIRTSRGASGINSINTKTFKQFLALKCFEILKRLKIAEDLGENSASIDEFRRLMGNSEMFTANFLDEAFGIVEHLIDNGEEE